MAVAGTVAGLRAPPGLRLLAPDAPAAGLRRGRPLPCSPLLVGLGPTVTASFGLLTAKGIERGLCWCGRLDRRGKLHGLGDVAPIPRLVAVRPVPADRLRDGAHNCCRAATRLGTLLPKLLDLGKVSPRRVGCVRARPAGRLAGRRTSWRHGPKRRPMLLWRASRGGRRRSSLVDWRAYWGRHENFPLDRAGLCRARCRRLRGWHSRAPWWWPHLACRRRWKGRLSWGRLVLHGGAGLCRAHRLFGLQLPGDQLHPLCRRLGCVVWRRTFVTGA